MSGTKQHTWQKHHVAHLNITVVLDAPVEGHNLERHQALSRVTRQLIDVMESVRLPITWAVSDPAHSAATALILKSALDHELAILGDANWIGPTAGRTRFARELVRRVSQARAANLTISTLVPNVAPIGAHIDLIVKQRITGIAGLTSVGVVRPSLQPRALHYGVWEVPVAATVPLKGRWFSSGKWTTWRLIQRAVSDAGGFHLMIEAANVAAAGPSELAAAIWLLRRIATFRDRGLVCVETLRRTSARLSDVPVGAPQRSILRQVA